MLMPASQLACVQETQQFVFSMADPAVIVWAVPLCSCCSMKFKVKGPISRSNYAAYIACYLSYCVSVAWNGMHRIQQYTRVEFSTL